MRLNRLTYHNTRFSQLVHRTGFRRASTIVGQHGRVYVQGEVLSRREDEELNIFKAEYVLTFGLWSKAQTAYC